MAFLTVFFLANYLTFPRYIEVPQIGQQQKGILEPYKAQL